MIEPISRDWPKVLGRYTRSAYARPQSGTELCRSTGNGVRSTEHGARRTKDEGRRTERYSSRGS